MTLAEKFVPQGMPGSGVTPITWKEEKEFPGRGAWTLYGPFEREMSLLMQSALTPGRNSETYKASHLETEEFSFIAIGAHMENKAVRMDAVSESCKEAVATMKDAFNEVKSLMSPLDQDLLQIVRSTRTHRMAVTTELRSALTVMKDVRKFFLDKDHKEEVERLEHFVEVAERMRSLIQDGTMDAVCDVVIKLMESAPENGEGVNAEKKEPQAKREKS